MKNDLDILPNNNGQIDSILSSVFNFTDDTVSIIDPDGNFIYINQDLPNFKKEEILGQSIYNILPDKISPQIKTSIKTIIDSGRSLYFHSKSTAEEDEAFPTQFLMIPSKTEDGKVWAITVISAIFNEIIAPREKPENNDQSISSVIKALDQNSILHVIDTERNFIKVNSQFCRLSGYFEHEIVGKSTTILDAKIQGADFWESMWKTLLSGNTWKGEVCFKAKDKTLYWLSSVINPITDINGEIYQFIAVSQDISERKKAESDLEEVSISFTSTEQELMAIFEELQSTQRILEENQKELKAALAQNIAITNALENSALISVTNLGGVIIKANNIFCEVSGYAESELLGRDHRMLNSGFHPKSFWIDMWKTISKGKTWHDEVCNRAKDGSLYWVDTVINPIRNEKGKIYQYMSIRNLITDRKNREDDLKVALAQNIAITNALDNSALVSIADAKGRISKANAIFCEVSGYSESELLGQDHKILNSGFHPKSFWKDMWKTVSKGKTWRAEVCNRAKDGSLYWVDTVINPIRDEKGKIYQYLSIRYLITERKNGEEELKYANNLLDKSNEAAQIGTWDASLDTQQITWSKVTRQIFEVEEDYLPRLNNILPFYKDGESRDTMSRLFSDIMEKGEKYDVELQIITAQGREKWIRNIGIPIMENGKCVRCYGTVQDIDEKKKAHLEIQRLSLVASKTHNGIVITDPQGGITWVNESFYKITGYALNEVLGKTPNSFLHGPETSDEDNQKILMALSRKESINQEILHYNKQGMIFWEELNITPILDDQGEIIQWICIQNDVTNRKQAEISLKQSEQRIKDITNSVPGVICVFKQNPDSTTSIEFMSEYCETLWELKKEEILADSNILSNTILEEDLPKMTASFAKSIQDLSLWSLEWRIQTKSGKFKWLGGKGIPQKQEDGSVIWNFFIADITERKGVEESLIKAYDLLERSNEVARMGTWEVDLSSMKLTWSKVTKEIYEVEKDYQPVEESAIIFYKEGESRDEIIRLFTACVEKGEHFDSELQVVTAKGNELWVRVIGIPVLENGICVRAYGLLQDIDLKTKTLKQLGFQEELFRKTYENAPTGIALVDLEGNWFKMNESFCKILGYSEKELQELSFYDITHPDEKEDNGIFFKQMLASLQENFQTEKRYIHKNGSLVWATISISAVKNDKGKIIHFVYQINDITKMKVTQLLLQEHIKRLQGVLDASTQVGIIEADLEGNIKIFNKGAENLLGYRSDEVINKITTDIFLEEHDIQKFIDGLPEKYQKLFGRYKILNKLLEKEFLSSREWTFIHKNGSTFPGLLSVSPIFNAHNKISGSLAIITDLTQIREAEKENKSLLDVTQGQNDRLLNFAHIVSHNLRSHSANLTMIMDLMEMEENSVDDYFFPLLKEASDHLKETILHLNDVVAMNTKTHENLTNLNLSNFISKAIANVNALMIEAECKVHINVPKDIGVMAIPAYLESTLLNLLTNAIKYKSPERKPEVTFTSGIIGDYVLLNVQDNGIGIDLQVHGAKLFGMYKTFHGNEDARGIGLFITKNQVEAMGGHIEVESEVNKGTTFKIYFLYEKN